MSEYYRNDLAFRAAALLERRRREEIKKRDRYKYDPLSYIVDVLGVSRNTLDWDLIPGYRKHKYDGTPNPIKKALDAIGQSRWVGIEAATGTGKTFLLACIAAWFYDTFENSVVVTTAPKEKQLALHLWKELVKFKPKIPGYLGKLCIRRYEGRDDWLIVGFVAGQKADEESATKAQGFHAEHLLIIVEETPGVPEPTFTAFQNTLTSPHNLMIAVGNPDHQMDNLHKFCLQKNVEHIRISAYDHPNVVLDNPEFIVGAQTRVGLERLRMRYIDRNNPLYLSRARGICPKQSIDSLIRLEWLIAARDNQNKEIQGMRALGVDVANSVDGDKAAIAEGIGNKLISVEDFQCPNANQLGEMVAIRMASKKIAPEHVGIDGVGVGAGTVNTLFAKGLNIVDIQSGAAPVKTDNEVESFNNLRSQMWWKLRTDLENGLIVFPDDIDINELFADLVSVRWTIRNGKIIIESKEEIKKRLGRSPNKGDAVVYWNWVRSGKHTNRATKGGQLLTI